MFDWLKGTRSKQDSEDTVELVVPEGKTFVLFVCTANLSRSPMAEAMFRHEVQIDGTGRETDRWIGLGFHPHSHKLEPFRQQLRESLYGDF